MKKFFTVLGGMGTLATESYVRLLDQRTPIHRDQDYLDYIVVNHASIPDRTTWILDHSQPDYNKAPILNMLEETVAEIKRIKPDAKKVGLLATRGTVEAGLYDGYITKAGYEEIKPTPEILDMTEDLIYHDIKEAGHSDGQKYHELVRKMVEEEGADVVILGCTELSYAQEMNPETEFSVADSQSIIVDRSLERGMKLEGRATK